MDETEILEALNGPLHETVPTPFPTLTERLPLNGWAVGKLSMVAARAENCATTFVLESARHASAAGHRVLYVSLRYGAAALTARMLASGARVPFGVAWAYLEADDVDDDARERLDAVHRTLGNVEIVRPAAGFTQTALDREVERRTRDGAPVLVIVDAVTSMNSDDWPGASAFDRREQMHRDLWEISRAHDCSVIAVVRIPGRNYGEPPTLLDLPEADDHLYCLSAQTMLLYRHREGMRDGDRVDVLIQPSDYGAPGAVRLIFTPDSYRLDAPSVDR